MDQARHRLEELRRGIERCDREIYALVGERRRLVAAIAALKRREGWPARDGPREEALLDLARSCAPGADDGELRAFHAALLRLCRPD